MLEHSERTAQNVAPILREIAIAVIVKAFAILQSRFCLRAYAAERCRVRCIARR